MSKAFFIFLATVVNNTLNHASRIMEKYFHCLA